MCLSGYMYLKVVRLKTLDLGKYEWKLQATVIGTVVSTALVFYFLGSFGSAGYW